MRYPYRSLPDNLTAFCARLRQRHGFGIGPGELQDAARALGLTRIADEGAVKDALRPVLCGRLADVLVFDAAFDAFFRPAVEVGDLNPAAGHPSNDASEADRQPAGEPGQPKGRGSEEDGLDAMPSSTVAPTPTGETDGEGAESGAVLRSSYSPLEAEGTAPSVTRVDASWRAAAAALVSAVRVGVSRRWRPARHGPRFDLRRTLRSSLHTGGDPVVPRWQMRPRQRPRFVLLVDGSRSMGASAQVALEIGVALAAATPSLEAFVFSTSLQRVTRDVRRAAAGERRRLDRLHDAWGGGTNIGASLQTFLHRFGERLLGRDSVVVIASDGLDVGGTAALRSAMARLHRSSASVIWLNPLLETPGYEPIASGMSAARPFISTFVSVADPAGLQRLARRVRIRR